MKKTIRWIALLCVLAVLLSFGGVAAAAEEADAQRAAEAQSALDEGLGYWFGTGADGYGMEEARAAFQTAADAGSAEAWYWLGQLRRYDVEADRWPQVVEYYQKAADLGCAKGLCGLGELYESGYGFEQDAEKAAALYQQAIDADELYGSVCLGRLYETDDGVTAAALYESALTADDFFTRNEARCRLGSLYYDGAEGVEADPNRALSCYHAAADEDYYGGWNGLGYLYVSDNEYGDGIAFETDDAMTFAFDSRAAALGAACELAYDYTAGIGCAVDYARAIELFQQEAAGGRSAAAAMGGMAFMTSSGYGIHLDYTAAADWCRRSIAAAGPGNEDDVEYANYLLDWLAGRS